jgi:cell division protein FtsI (penicillin-binding protein 3)
MISSIKNTKLKIIYLIFVFSFSCVVFKAFQIQVLDKDDLILRSNNQIFREVKVYPRRGHIYDRNGSPLAINIQTYSIFTIPQDVSDQVATYRSLAKIIPDLTYDQIRKKVSNRTRFTWIARKIELASESVEKIKDLPGVYIEAVPKRLYPNRETLGQLLGFVGLDNIGLSGVEFLFDKELRGEPHVIRYVRDNKGRPIKFESREVGSNAKDIHLTVDKDLQAIAEAAIRDVVIEFEADSAGIGIMDPMTGEILAIANYPSFDPNNVKGSSDKNRRLSFVTDPFEPGSTLKTLTIASAFENKIARPDTNFFCEQGRFRVGNHVITEAESNSRFEWLSVEDILRHSSNIGTTKIAFDLKYPMLKKTLNDFGIGVRTGVEIPGESRGILTDSENISPLTLSNISFGQGVAATGLQMLRSYAVIANGGYLVNPTILKTTDEKIKKRIISQETADEIKRILVRAVDEGTGRNARVENFVIAGKTSTAQRVSPQGGYEGYVPGFIGFPVGVNHPFVISVYVNNPKSSKYYGNIVASPVFKKVAEYLLYKNKEYININLAEDEPSNEHIDRVRVALSSARFIGKGLAPNFLGLDKISSEKLAEDNEITVIHRGVGVVEKQIPEIGSRLDTKKPIVLYYKPPSL